MQNVIIHPSEAPSIPAAEMETSTDKDIVPSLQKMSAAAAAAAEESNVQVPPAPPPVAWWSYLGWSSSSAPHNPATSTSPNEPASMSSPPSDLRQPDLPSETQTTNSEPPMLSVPPHSIESTDSHISPPGGSTPSKTSAASPGATSHANESRGGEVINPAGSSNSNGNDGFNTSERDVLPRSLDSQEGNSDGTQQQQQQLESAEQSGAVVSSSNVPPPLASWFSPWSWYPNTSDQRNVDLSDASNNEESKFEIAGGRDPERVTREGGEYGLHDDTGSADDGRKRTDMASDSKNQNMGSDVGVAAQGQILGQPNSDRGENADNGTDTDAELTLSSESVSNPIEQSITTHRSGWASLFSSRRLVIKALGYKSTLPAGAGEVKCDENGMEVMEVDFDEDAASAEGKQDKDHSSDYGIDRRSTNGTLKGGKKAKTSPDGGSKPSQSTLPVPLTTSEDIKKETEQSVPTNAKKGTAILSSKPTSGPATPISRPLTPVGKISSTSSSPSATTFTTGGIRDRNYRPASPTPSSKKAPSPPNMVLPTWEDTFFTPPRSVIPTPAATSQGTSAGTGAKLLERAMGFVSGVLFSKDDTAPGMENSTGKPDGGDHNDGNLSAVEKERQEIFQHFGKELPRAWEIIERTTTGPGTSGTVDVSPGLTSAMPRNKSGRSSIKVKDSYNDATLGADERNHVYDVLRECKRVVVIGIHGWFPGEQFRL